MNKHNELKRIIEKKILLLNSKNEEELNKYKALYRLITDENEPFFGKINIDMAVSILTDIGVNKEEALNMYVSLIKEENDTGNNKKYTLIELPKDEIEQGGEER